ncbi:MAG: NTP transferase domain-containing protein [bacterium]|nr:bifunctional N-acetylglucosamine-1-phosphate uridyltransferase/glucosamine-1-phosphate acetyltransferase [Planctomycetota bacterium]HIL52948.1 bifunctional N-acetylglucosamine-1-phosphate uridyltransferase/glucosamine-1-phosphate acetyltransferase [Planctomycetota bacterium]
MSRAGTVVILAAGQGTRMQSARPKVLHELCGKTLIAWVLDQALSLDPERILVVVGHAAEEVEAEIARGPASELCECVVQEPQAGTGHALQVCLPALASAEGPVFVLYGDMPVLTPKSLQTLSEVAGDVAPEGMAMLTACPPLTSGLGRIARAPDGAFASIVEDRDCTPEELCIEEVNLGVYAFPATQLREYLPRLKNDNSQGEYYLTDVARMFASDGREVATVELADPDEALGVNTIAHLAEARWALQVRLLEEHMARGVAIEDPATTFIDADVEIGPGTRILPCTVIRGGVRIGAGCEVGPFTHLRRGSVLHDGAELGNFCEAKNSEIGAGTKAKHLSYLGDAQIGAGANIGAGTIFANYDGTHKHRTVVEDGAFIGSGTTIVAPGKIGAGATTGAGAVITRGAEVGPNEVWVGVPARRLTRTSVNETESETQGIERGAAD